jgi:hypothetical protein
MINKNLTSILPALPEGYRWKLAKSYGIDYVKLQKRCLVFWFTVEDSPVVLARVHGVEYAIQQAAKRALITYSILTTEGYYGTTR